MKRPKYLNLFEIRQPLPAVLSILHRISGAGLFLTLPLLIWALQLSLGSPEGYEDVRSAAGNPLARLPLLVLLWASIHHFCAGLRALLLDIHVGVEKAQALVSAWVVLAVSLLLTAVLGARLW